MAITRETLRLQDQIDALMREITDAEQRALQAAWGQAWDDLRGDLVRAVADTLATSGRITLAMLRRNRRLTLVLQQVIDRLRLLVGASEASTFAGLRSLVDSAIAAQRSILDSQLPPGFDLTQIARWSRVDQRQVDAMVLRAMERIHSQNQTLVPTAVAAMKRELVRGVVVGANPRVTARRIVQRAGEAGFGGGLNRATVIARTETLDAYREAGRIAQEPHSDVLAGWVWMASLSPRTCPACLSMHGREFEQSVPGPQGHQQCRCSRLPKLRSWADLGIEGMDDEPDDEVPDADAYFEGLSPAQKQAMLGKRGYQAWLAGEFPRDAWAVKRKSAGWRDSWVNAKPPAAQAGGSGGVTIPPPKGTAPGPGDPQPGRVTRPKGEKLLQHEIDTAHRIASLGIDVAFRTNPHDEKSVDAWVLGQLWEFKSPEGAGKSVIVDNLRTAHRQLAERVVMDLARTRLTADDTAAQVSSYWARRVGGKAVARVWVLPENVVDHFTMERADHGEHGSS